MFDFTYTMDNFTGGRVACGNNVHGEITLSHADLLEHLNMIPKVLRQMAIIKEQLELTPELQEERNEILLWLRKMDNTTISSKPTEKQDVKFFRNNRV